MGIRGLETFLESIYSSENRDKVYTDRELRKTRFVVDGNNFAYILSSLFASNRTGGNYDQYREFLKRVLASLANSIELIIFDGSKDAQAKALKRIENKCMQLSNTRNNSFQKTEEHEKFLSEYPAMFDRIVLQEVIYELGIKVNSSLNPKKHNFPD